MADSKKFKLVTNRTAMGPAATKNGGWRSQPPMRTTAGSPANCRVFYTDWWSRTGRVRYWFSGPVRPETGKNQWNTNFK
jgi:hypothetical protein